MMDHKTPPGANMRASEAGASARVVARRAPRTGRILNQVKVVKLGDLCALVGSVALSDSRSCCECRGAHVGLVRSSLTRSSGPAAVGRSASGAQAATGSVRRGLPARLGTCHVHARIHGAGGLRLSASEPDSERPGELLSNEGATGSASGLSQRTPHRDSDLPASPNARNIDLG